MCNSCCGGLVNIPVKRAKALILAQAQNKWQKQAYCLILFSIQDLHHTSSRWQKPYNFNVVASLMVLAQTVWPVWLLQGERNTNLSMPLRYDLWYLLVEPYLGRLSVPICAGESLSDTACMILAQHKNNVQIIIFREMPWDKTSYLDKNKLPI